MKITHCLSNRFVLALATPPWLAVCASAQSANVSVSITSGGSSLRTGAIPSDFLGISLEASSITAANNNGGQWLSGNTTAFSNLIKRIGVKSIRIGGNSAERLGYPSLNDAKAAGDFANLTGSNLLWVLPVKNNTYSAENPAQNASFAESMFDDQLAKGYTFQNTFLIGNEPDIDMAANGSNPDDPAVPQSTWQFRFDHYEGILHAHNSAITASGPSFASDATYATSLANDSTYAGALHSYVGYVTGHTYPLGSAASNGASNSQQAITAMLQNNNSRYQSFYDKWASTAASQGFRSRIDETNSMFFDGATQDLLHEYAASLWVLDYLCYMAYHTNLGGMNLHNGPIGSNGYNTFSPIGLASSYTLQAVGYGMFAFSFNGQGTPMSANVTSNSAGLNVSAYALQEANGTASAHILNKEHGSGSSDAVVTISIPGYAHAEVMYLAQTTSNVTADTGITLGGQPVNSDGTWTGNYTVTGLNASNGTFTVTVPHTQAAIVHFFN